MTKRASKILVNALSVSRIIGALCLPFAIVKFDIPVLIGLLVVLFLTDFLDGKLSRRWGVQTVGGMILDPIGDKLLAVACMVSLVSRYKVMWALIILEAIIAIINVYRVLCGQRAWSSIIGKIKTWFLGVTIVLMALSLFMPNIFDTLLEFVGVETHSFRVSEGAVMVSFWLTVGIELATIVFYLKETLASEKRKTARKTYEFKSVKEILSRLFDEKTFLEDRDRPIIDIIRK